jgi:competence CoiA-like predicted nuclease
MSYPYIEGVVSMLTAVCGDKIISISDLDPETMKRFSNQKKLTCLDCGSPLIYKHYQTKKSHFSHHESDCTYPFREPESIEHESGKNALLNWIHHQKIKAKAEQYIPITQQRADIMVTDPQIAIEFQCSPIHPDTWLYRHNLYSQANIRDIWILGYSMHHYFSLQHPYAHKLNPLERTILEHQNRLIYFDTLTNKFILLTGNLQPLCLFGNEYLVHRNEMFLDPIHFKIHSKFDPFFQLQHQRKETLKHQSIAAQSTSKWIEAIKEKTTDTTRVLASKKQINYIKFLLTKQNKTIPYKLNGILKTEAISVIKELVEKQKTPT